MNKEKIAIAIDAALLRQIDSLIDGTSLKSRSQAISYFLQKGLKEQSIKKAIILLHKDHHHCALEPREGIPYIAHQIRLFARVGVSDVIILTQESDDLAQITKVVEKEDIKATVITKNTKGTADSVFELKNHVKHENFIVMSGDTYNDFDLQRMVLRHFEHNAIATMGLVNKEVIKNHGVVLLDGTHIIDFDESPEKPKSHIINAGIYVFRPEIFEFISDTTISLEKDVFSRLAKIKQLHGYFTHGTYVHISE